MNKITYSNEVIDAYSGQINCEAGIYLNSEIIGVAQYVLYKGEFTISYIFIRPEFRRMGYGSRLLGYIDKINPKYKYRESFKTDLGAKFVKKDISLDESIGNILKPKSREDLFKALKQKHAHNYDEFITIFKKLPYLNEYLNVFYLELLLYVREGKWKKYIDPPNVTENGYQFVDVTKEAKEIILESIKNIKSLKPLKVIEFNWIDSSKFHSFLSDLNIISMINKSYWEHYYDNNPFKWVYGGVDYSWLGRSDGFSLFIMPEDFLDKVL